MGFAWNPDDELMDCDRPGHRRLSGARHAGSGGSGGSRAPDAGLLARASGEHRRPVLAGIWFRPDPGGRSRGAHAAGRHSG
jgi:hypothetical protein